MGANQNARKLLSIDFVNTKVGYESTPSETTPARNTYSSYIMIQEV